MTNDQVPSDKSEEERRRIQRNEGVTKIQLLYLLKKQKRKKNKKKNTMKREMVEQQTRVMYYFTIFSKARILSED